MSLTMGTGPFGSKRSGTFNFDVAAVSPKHTLYLEPCPKRLRIVVAGETVADSRRGLLLHETGLLPRWYFLREDVRFDLLEPTDHSTHCPFKGDASYWTLRVGDRVEDNAVWGYEEPVPEMAQLAGLVSFYGERVDEMWEEDERIVGHPRDPFHRVDTRPSSRHVVVRVGGETVADSRRPVGVFETGLPVRWYLPPDDVDMARLEPTEHRTTCPYKGHTSYWTVSAAGVTAENAAWTYSEPFGETLMVEGMLCFLGEGVKTTVDGEPVE